MPGLSGAYCGDLSGDHTSPCIAYCFSAVMTFLCINYLADLVI